jgi:hypothetical protein
MARKPKRLDQTTAEQMAIAVLRGDMVAARALADYIMEDLNSTSEPVKPLEYRLPLDVKDLRAVLYLDESYENPSEEDLSRVMDRETFAFERWISGEMKVLVLPPGVRMELFTLASQKM